MYEIIHQNEKGWKAIDYYLEISQSQSTDEPRAPLERDTEKKTDKSKQTTLSCSMRQLQN